MICKFKIFFYIFVESQYKSIPSKIEDATAASISKTNADNHRYAQIASAILIGKEVTGSIIWIVACLYNSYKYSYWIHLRV